MSFKQNSPNSKDIPSLKCHSKNLNSVDYTNKKDRLDR